MEQKTIEQLIGEAKGVFLGLFKLGHPVCLAWSGGKDSSCVANIALLAAKESVAEGLVPMVVVTNGDTLVDNPEITMHCRSELAKMVQYGKKHGFEVITKIVTPNLSSTWQIKVLSGRGLPSYMGVQADCSVDLKVKPQQVFRRRLFKQLKKQFLAEPVICIGTRFDESSQRAANMESRGESATLPVRNKDGELVLSPIANWTTDDVWEMIGLAASGLMDSYSDFAETKRIYAHAESMSCAVVADSLSTGKARGKCGARTGCFVCQQAEDKSLENMTNYDERYAYARGLIKFNKFVKAIRYDWNRRHWFGRTIKAGYIALQPDTFHPSTLRELFRYMLQLDFDEQERARAAQTVPMFELLPFKMIVAIDAIWSLNGSAAPFAAWADYRDIFEHGVRYDIPDIEVAPETPLPVARYLHVGNEWDDERNALSTGMRDLYVESLTADSACGTEMREMADGRTTWDLDTESSFDVNVESAYMLLDFELDSMMRKYDAGRVGSTGGMAYKYYLQYGALTLSHSQVREHDHILRRTAFKERLWLDYEYDIKSLLTKSVGFDDLPEEARIAWGHKHKHDTKTPKVIHITNLPPTVAVMDIKTQWHQDDFFERMVA